MTNLDRLPSALILSSLTTLLVACGGKEEVVQAPPPKPRPVVTQSEPVVVEVKQLSGTELIAKLNLDPRLMLSDDMAGTQQERGEQQRPEQRETCSERKRGGRVAASGSGEGD